MSSLLPLNNWFPKINLAFWRIVITPLGGGGGILLKPLFFLPPPTGHQALVASLSLDFLPLLFTGGAAGGEVQMTQLRALIGSGLFGSPYSYSGNLLTSTHLFISNHKPRHSVCNDF